jgi:prepilin-type N-terminal cleavage/methylation domain-containing protein
MAKKRSCKEEARQGDPLSSPITHHPSPIASKKGFTLLELIVVIFILSLVLAVSLPSLSGIGESKVKSDAKRLGSIVRYLSDSAITTKNTLQVTITFAEKVVRYVGPDGEKAERFDALSGIELQSMGMVSEGEVTVFFSPLGASESFILHLTDDKSDMSVAFNGMSGRVKIAKSTT